MGFAEDMANFPLTSFNYESRGGNSDFRVLTSDYRLPAFFYFYFIFFIFFLIFFVFFVINSSEQHTATDLVNFFIIAYRFRLITDFVRELEQDSEGTYFIPNHCSTMMVK